LTLQSTENLPGQTTCTNFEQGHRPTLRRMVKTAAFAEEFCYV
jgi:hypothetical protein